MRNIFIKISAFYHSHFSRQFRWFHMPAFANVTTIDLLHHRQHVFGNWGSIQSNKFIEYPRHISIEFNGKYWYKWKHFCESATLAVKHILLLTQNKQYQLHRQHNYYGISFKLFILTMADWQFYISNISQVNGNSVFGSV